MLIIPEVIFIKTLKAILKIVRDDFNNNIDKTKSILYRIANGSGALERYDFYTQLQKVLITDLDDPRAFDFVLGFNMNKVAVPTLHITLPSETSAPNGIGIDEGFAAEIFDDTTQAYRKVYTRRFNTTYQFVLTSNNSNEVIALYHFLRALDISLINHFELSGLQHIVISGGDVNINPALVPPNVFIRSISLNFAYEIEVQDLFTTDFVTSLIFAMNPPIIDETQVDESDSNSWTLP